MVQHPAEKKDISLLWSVKTDFGIYPVPYSVHSGITATGDRKLATHLYIVPMLRMHGTIHPLSHILWMGHV